MSRPFSRRLNNVPQHCAVLRAFNIRKGVTDGGVEIEPDIGFEPGVVSHPVPFGARVTQRSERHEQLVRDLERIFPWERSDADKLDGRWSVDGSGSLKLFTQQP